MPAHHFVDGRDQFVTRRLLQHESGGAVFQALRCQAGLGVHREDDDFRGVTASTQRAERFEPAHPRHRQVQEHHIRVQPPHFPLQVVGVVENTDDLSVAGEQTAKSFGKDGVIVCEKHSRKHLRTFRYPLSYRPYCRLRGLDGPGRGTSPGTAFEG